ncbi:MAG: LLM class flavin-dependent oxidoreductase [Chloroflexi bacterium]|nr:LLM class flavin-dependent oxidoreductase [Chloroflexota bacterium]
MPKIGVFMFQDFGYPAYMESARLAEESGFDIFGLIDSTDAYSDYCPWAGLVAVDTSKILVGPWVTNPLTRHPRVTANHMLTIHELSRGRAVLGLGTGANAVRTLGWEPAKHSVMREAMETFRNKFKEKKADIPIYVGTGGPLNTKMAMQMADGIIGAGVGGIHSSAEGVLAGIEHLKAMAKEVGRDFNTLSIKFQVGFAISHNRKEAIEEMKWSVSSMMRGIFVERERRSTIQPSTLPPDLEHFREEARRVGEAYDWFDHMRSHSPNGQLARHAQASDELVEAVGLLAGTPAEVLPRFKTLWQAASSMPNVGMIIQPHGSKGGRKRSFDLFVKEILPKLRSQRLLHK